MGVSFGNKYMRVSMTKNGVGWSAGNKGFRVGHRANAKKSENNGGWFFTLFITPIYWICVGTLMLMWLCVKYPCWLIYKFVKWIISKFKRNSLA